MQFRIAQRITQYSTIWCDSATSYTSLSCCRTKIVLQQERWGFYATVQFRIAHRITQYSTIWCDSATSYTSLSCCRTKIVRQQERWGFYATVQFRIAHRITQYSTIWCDSATSYTSSSCCRTICSTAGETKMFTLQYNAVQLGIGDASHPAWAEFPAYCIVTWIFSCLLRVFVRFLLWVFTLFDFCIRLLFDDKKTWRGSLVIFFKLWFYCLFVGCLLIVPATY